MDKDVAISVQNVTMSFNLNKEKVDNLKEYAIKLLTHKLEYKKFNALNDISFEVKKGEHLAILGFNGAGKSTLLKTIVGVYKPTKGTVERCGVIAPLLELGAGFDGNYTGKENIFLYGAILGYSRDYLASKYDEIVEFSELGKFIDVPLKNYSSGMRARLGFSIATAVEPDVLILDEVLSVGDAKFREKSLKKVQSMFESGVTVIFVSHSIAQVKKLCDKAILLYDGGIAANGEANAVADLYEKVSKLDKKNTKRINEEITKFNVEQRKKELEAQAKKSSYDEIYSSISDFPKADVQTPVQKEISARTASVQTEMPIRTEHEAKKKKNPAEHIHIDIPKKETAYTASTAKVFEDVFSSSDGSPAVKSSLSQIADDKQSSSVAKADDMKNINSSSSVSGSSESQLSRDEIEEIIKSFSK